MPGPITYFAVGTIWASRAYVLFCDCVWIFGGRMSSEEFIVWILWLLWLFVIYICELNYSSCKKRCSYWKEEYPRKINNNGTQFLKRAIFDLLFTFFSHQGKNTKVPSANISLTYIPVFCSPYWLFYLTNFAKITNLSCMVSLWFDSWCWFFFTPFWSNQLITKWWAKFRLECLLLIFIYTNAEFIVICKPPT